MGGSGIHHPAAGPRGVQQSINSELYITSLSDAGEKNVFVTVDMRKHCRPRARHRPLLRRIRTCYVHVHKSLYVYPPPGGGWSGAGTKDAHRLPSNHRPGLVIPATKDAHRQLPVLVQGLQSWHAGCPQPNPFNRQKPRRNASGVTRLRFRLSTRTKSTAK